MKTNLKLGLALLAGAAIGLGAAQAIHAQQPRPAPAFVIAEVEPDPSRPADPAAMKRYATEAPRTMAAWGGRYVVRGGKVLSVEGEPPKGYVVVIGFDSLEKAQGWYNSPEYAAVRPIRQNSTKSRIMIAEGVAGS